MFHTVERYFVGGHIILFFMCYAMIFSVSMLVLAKQYFFAQ